MKLKTLEISGFKSFADTVRIDFRPGISAVVGPNGCGKSNIADAMRWVLGTQSPRQLRAEKMESVIFSGSSGRKQMGMAEVTLTFDNSDRIMGLDYDEVSVSRRLFRSGESEYSINGARCRLMDITDLVVDRGLGSTGYWILESKMVGTILSNRPEDRRSLFDEAAGIVKYKIQRHRAELKLDSTGSDLERLADIINEVDSGCRSLARQVSACRRHEKLTGEIKDLIRAKALIEASVLGGELDRLRKSLEGAGAEVGRETALLGAAGASLAERKMEFASVQAKLDDAHRECAGLDSEIAAIERESAVAAERIASLGTRVSENTARMAGERERFHEYSQAVEKTVSETLALSESIKLADDEYGDACSFREKTSLELRARRESLSRTSEELSLVDRELRELGERRVETIRRREAAAQKGIFLKDSIDELSARLAKLAEEKAVNSSRLELLLKNIADARSALDDHRLRLVSMEGIVAEYSADAASLDREIAVASDGVDRMTRVSRRLAEEGGIWASLKPSPGRGKALGAFFHGFGKARAVECITTDSPGEGSLYACENSGKAPPVPPGCISLEECLDEDCGPVLRSVLTRGVLAPDRNTALEIIAGGYPCTVVTAAGDLFRPEGLVRLGVGEEDATQLELAQLIEEQIGFLDEKTARRQNAVERLNEAVAQEKELRSSASEVRERLGVMEKESASVESLLSSAGAESALLRERLEALKRELHQLESAESDSGCMETADETRRFEEQRIMLAARIEQQTAELDLAEKAASGASATADELSFVLREKRSAHSEAQKRIDFLQRELGRMEESMESADRENTKALSSITDLEEKLNILRSDLEALKTRRGEAEGIRSGFTQARNSLMEATAVLEREVQQIRDRLGKARSLMIELEGRVSSLEERMARLEGPSGEGENRFTGLSEEELEREISARADALEKLGPVNMLAVTEYEETKARLDYLSQQRDDLQEARESLSRAITEINEEAARRFDETFSQVRHNFREMFVKLFEGGEGDIVSLPGEDPLEGGIEILARPGGKKLKNVIALSDGERAMTAVVLLFSLYLVKPSPFCVLDELDSPFDDTNTDKFVSILRDFCDSTQFIVITHNKRTMEGSDVLYGVTMAEEGVSNMTSVSLEEMAGSS
jgi:chromosome segregation protein